MRKLHPLEYQTLQAIRGHGLLAPGAHVVVGVSGGGDSLALLLVLAALREELALELTALYADHGLRPEETRAESDLVAAMATGLGVAFRREALPVREYAGERGLSLEAAGRELRYRWFGRVAGELGGAVVAVAHHGDDQAEELLLRLLRGSGLAGLSGMRARNEQGVIRPFLDFPKARLAAYLRDRLADWREDGSNLDPRFLRNRVRLELLPLLEQRFNPATRQVLQRTAAILAAEDDLLGGLAGAFYRRVLVGEVRDGTEGYPNELTLDIAQLRSGHLALQRRVLEKALLELGAPVAFRQVEAILKLAAEPGGELHLPGGLRVSSAYGVLAFSYPAGRGGFRGRLARGEESPFEMEIAGPGLWLLPGRPEVLVVEVLTEVPAPAELSSGHADHLDLAGLSFPLRARSPRAGDRFRPLGAPGSRKVADFLCDRKLPAVERARLVVLESGGRIVALVGQRIDHSCRVTAATTGVLRVSLRGCENGFTGN